MSIVKHCRKCGTEVAENYQFCPKCGNEFKDLEKSELPDSILICDNCGEENDIDNNICSYCGIKLQGSGKNKIQSNTSKKNKNDVKKSEVKSEQISNKKNQKEQSKPKNLDNKTTLLIVSGIIILCLLALIFSGILNKPETPNQNFNFNQNQNSGVDLSSLKKINELEANLKANPNNDEILLQLAHLKNDSGLYEQAIVNYKEYLKKHPEDADARIDMGVCYYNLGNYNTAISEMENALKYSPKHQIGYLNLGIVNLAIGNTAKSKEWLEGALKINPNTEAGKKAKEILESHK